VAISLGDMSPLDLNIVNYRIRENTLQSVGSFERILQEKMGEVEGRPGLVGRVKSEKLMDACYEMEALFIGQMLKTMRNTLMETDFFGKSMVKDIFNDMLYDEYARKMARADQLGLAKQIYEHVRTF
jgi:flagellar protein FlgJ